MGWLIRGVAVRGLAMLLAPTAQRFRRCLRGPEQTQQALQTTLVKHLSRSDYGRSFGIKTVDDWHRLPIVTYDDVRPWIGGEIGEENTLTAAPILFYEQTSGSSGAAKRIPYTQALRQSFSRLFCIWAYDLISHGPRFETGKFYLCISPKLLASGEAPGKAPGKVSEGLQDDSEYLDPWLRWLLRPFLVLSPEAHRPQTPEVFQANLCKTLLLEEALEIISIWSPSFLTVQLAYIQTHRHQLQRELRGQLSPERSAALLARDTIDWEALWPRLKLISCWDNALAADQARGLRSQFPTTLIQGKGLLATEAPMTVPLIAAQGCVPMLTEVFFEFENGAGEIYRLHELELGQIYDIIISQKGGLYRYRIGDRIQVTHYYQATPCLTFLGRSHGTSDLVGEKLTVAYVSQVLAQLDLPAATFTCLVPSWQPQPHYTLLMDSTEQAPEPLAQHLEALLSEAVHYRQARLLGQLQPATVIGAEDMGQRLTRYRCRQGQRWGDLKHPCLLHTPINLQEISENPDISSESAF